MNRTEHETLYTLALACGCCVFVRDGDSFGQALEDVEPGGMLRIGRRCPLHGATEVIAIADNAAGGYIRPA